MLWLVSARKEIVQSEDELLARSEYIRDVVNMNPSEWRILQLKGSGNRYYMCHTNDTYNGAVITGHIDEIAELVHANLGVDRDFIVVNTCLWNKMNDKKILYQLMGKNRNVKLWFAKQSLTLESDGVLRRTNTLSNTGNFGFPTSKSERILYASRKKGFVNALEIAYDFISPVILSGDY